jgi:hypothetical protein
MDATNLPIVCCVPYYASWLIDARAAAGSHRRTYAAPIWPSSVAAGRQRRSRDERRGPVDGAGSRDLVRHVTDPR